MVGRASDTSGVRKALILSGIAVLAGCGGHGGEKLPASCSEGPEAVLKALAAAPAAVRLDGVAISHCFNRNASADDVQIVGSSLVPAAQQLGDRAAAQPEGPAALQLGYLLAAARRGAARNGLADDLVRRLEQEEGSLPGRSRAFERGLRAGSATG
jgi:hypothetical protein